MDQPRWALDEGADLPWLPAARDRQQRLQRQRRAGAGAARPRGASALPGPGGGLAALGRRDRRLALGRPARRGRAGRGQDHRLHAGHRRPPADLRRRRVRGVPRPHLPRAERRRGRGLHRGQRRRRPRRRRPSGRRRRRARQPPRHGPGDPRPRRPRLRGEGPRQRALLHGDAASRASFPTRARGWPRRGPCWSAPATPGRASGRRSRCRGSRSAPGWGRRGSTSRRSRRSTRATGGPSSRTSPTRSTATTSPSGGIPSWLARACAPTPARRAPA